MSNQFDAIVVGSGISGGWAAKELTQRGLKVLVLERGKAIQHGTDYQGEHQPAWAYKFRGKLDPEVAKRDYPIQSQFGWTNAFNLQYWNNDRLNPYIYDEDKPFHWVRTDVLGGRSLVWGRQSYRWSDLDFEANKKDGHGIDWPIRYKDIAPWYDHVEKFVGVSGEKLGLKQLPDGHFQKPMDMNVVEKHVRGCIHEHYPDRTMTIGRVSILTEPLNGRAACHYCGPCSRGCSTKSYFSTLTTTLPAAEATGNLTLRTDSVVEGLDYDPEQKRITGVRVIDSRTKERSLFTARMVFLNASTIGSTQIMLNSASESFPDGLANRSGALGRYMMDHTFQTSVGGTMPGFEDKAVFGHRPNGVYIPRFRNLEGQDRDADFVRGYGYQGGARRPGPLAMAGRTPGFGAELKRKLAKPGPWQFGMSGFGEILPHKDNTMSLERSTPDRFGIPQVRFNVEYRENEKRMINDIIERGKEMLVAAGVTNIWADPGPMIPGRGVHEMGTARMGRDPEQSVLNGWNQAHDVPNLFVTDGACMTSGSCVNPSITYMALTARAANHAVDLLAEGKI